VRKINLLLKMEESIYNIIPEDPQPPRRYKKYKSQFPGNIEPSYSTFGNHSNIIQVSTNIYD